MAVVGNVIGDVKNFTAVKKDGVTLHNFPEVDNDKLADIAENINEASVSGKRLGAHVMGVTRNASGVATAAILYVAAGEKPADPWVFVADIVGTGGASVTPA